MTKQLETSTDSGIALGADLLAGLSIAGLLLPEAVAYASIGNLPPAAGVIALFAGLLCYSLLGSSRFAIVSATSSSAAVLAAASASLAGGDPVLRLALGFGLVLLAGVFFVVFGLARMGSVSDFIAKPVLRGFAFGLALVIVIKQLPKILGIHIQGGDIASMLSQMVEDWGHWNQLSIAVGLLALVLLFICARFRRVPGGLLVIALGIAAQYYLDLQAHGVALVGHIDLQLPKPDVPKLDHGQWMRIGELGFAMLMILYAESYSSIRNFALKHGDTVQPNRDLLALGAANIVSALFHGMPVGAGYSATSANEAAGAQSRKSAIVAALFILAIVLTLLSAIALTPEPVLGAIVIHAVSHTLNPSVFRRYFTLHRDRIVVIAGVVGVLVLGVLDGLLAAIAISILMMLRRFAESSVAVLGRLGEGHDFVNRRYHPESKPIEQVLILRPDEPLFFANAERVLGQARKLIDESDPSTKAVILSLEESPDLDSSSIEALSDFADFVARQNKSFALARLKEPVQQVLERSKLERLLPSSFASLSVDEVVGSVLHQLKSGPAV